MKPTPLLPAVPQAGAGPRWGLAASAVVHGLVLLALLGFAIRHLPPDGSPSPSYDLVFEGPTGGAPPTTAPPKQALPPAQPADLPPPPDAAPGPPAPTPLSTPDPNAATSPPPAAEAAPPPQPVAPPAPPTPIEVPTTPEPPAVRLEMPPTEPTPEAQDLIMPEPPPPLPPVEPQPQPQPQPQPRPVRPAVRPAPRSAVGTLSNPMDLSLGPAAPRPAARGSVASRSLDLSPPQERDGPARSDPYAQIRAAKASADWNRGLLQYWLQHRYYPEQAAANGEQGSVTIQLTVNRSGKVESVEVLSRSGSQWLDMAALGTWRNAQLPPFTNEMREDRITFPIPIQYYLIRR